MMNIRSNLIPADKVGKNGWGYTKSALEKLVADLNGRGVPILNKIDLDNLYGGIELNDLLGFGTLYFKDDVLQVEATIMDVDITDKYMVTVTTASDNDISDDGLINNVDSDVVCVVKCDDSSFYDEPNIEVVHEGFSNNKASNT